MGGVGGRGYPAEQRAGPERPGPQGLERISVAERIEAYAHGLLEIAQAEGRLDDVEDELFRFARIVEGNDDLRMALASPGLSAERRAAIVDELLEGRTRIR